MPGIDKKLLSLAALIIVFTLISILSIGCADEPSSLGLTFIPPGDTGSVQTFDSYVDTMAITSTTHKKYTNTSKSEYLMVGKTGDYDSKAILQFFNLSKEYDSADVISARLKLKYRNYYFPAAQSDSLGQISFNIYRMNDSLDLSRITLDSIDNNTFGTTSEGNYTGVPTADSQEVDIDLSTAMVKDWLEVAANYNYPNKNWGIVLSPNISSNVIKAFYSGASTVNGALKPELNIIVFKNNDYDTLNYDPYGTISLVNNTTIAPTNELFFLQAGIAYVQVLKFDFSRFPAASTINDVQLFLTLDPASSKFSASTNYTVGAQRVTDTAGLQTEGYGYLSTIQGDNKYMIRVIAASQFQISPFQRWLRGEANYGLYIYPVNIQSNLDMFAFYNTTSSDPNKRPRVIIKYTPRRTQ